MGRRRGAIIANIVPDLDPKWGGTSVSVPGLCKAMYARDKGVRLYFATDDRDGSWPEYGRPHRKSNPSWWHRSASLCRALQDEELAVVHHHALWLPSLGYAHKAARRWGCPFVISPEGMLSPYGLSRARLKKWLARRLLHPGAMEGATAWHVTSDEEFREIRAAGFKQPITVLSNGIEVPDWDEERDRDLWFGLYPELQGKRVCLFYSRLHSKKGLLPLVQMWGNLARRHGDWHLLVVGIPHEFTVDRVRAYGRKMGVSERMTIVDGSGMSKPYGLAELFVLPTRAENFGLVVGEALGAGVPVLVSREAPWEKVNELGCGACVPLSQFEQFLDRMLACNNATLRSMGVVGKEWVRREFSWDRIADEMLQFYQSLS